MTIGTLLLRSAACAIPLLIATLRASAQGFNVDCDLFNSPPEVGGGPPSSAFAGATAGQVGFWNAYPDNFGDPFPLRDTSGSATSVIITGTGLFGSGGWNNPINTGDYNLLLNDAQQVGADFSYTLSGLTPGRYLIYTYAAMPAPGSTGDAYVTISGSITPNPQRATGVMPGNSFILGVTHTLHEVQVSASTVRIDVADPWPRHAFVNGLQLVPVPEPATVIASGIGIAAYAFRRRRRV